MWTTDNAVDKVLILLTTHIPVNKMLHGEIINIDSSSSDEGEWDQEEQHIVVPDAITSFLCPSGRTLMRDPVMCADGHSYERANIVRWFRTSQLS
jgi:hypothetical protein